MPKKIKGQHKDYHAERLRLEKLPLTPLGRRILMRQVLLSKTGDVGTKSLAVAIGCEELTVLRILKTSDECWYDDPKLTAKADKLVAYLRADRSWLFSEIDYGDLGKVEFDLWRQGTRIRDYAKKSTDICTS